MKGTRNSAMKTSMGNFAMNIFGRLCRGARSPASVALGSFLLLALLACEQPFRAGLGTLVDAERPGVSLTNPGGGSFLRGDEGGLVAFTGNSWDDLRVEVVQFKITSHPGLIDEDAEIDESELPESWLDVEIGSPYRRADGRVGRLWEQSLNVSVLRDGELRVQLRVSDGIERGGSLWEYKDETVFFIRNTPPAITLSLPFVEDADLEEPRQGQLGSRNLNFGFIGHGDLGRLGDNRAVDGDVGMIVGMIRDDRGVNLYRDSQAGRAPPQFRLWEITDLESHPDALPGIPILRLDELTEGRLDALEWREFGQAPGGSGFIPISATNVQFFYNFPYEARGRYFAFQIRAQSEPVDGHFDTFLFPREEWSYVAWNDLDGNERIENSFVAFRIVPPQYPPNLELLRFQNVFYGGAWNPGLGDYDDIPGLDDDALHPLMTDLAFNAKSGAFTLRVRASHEDGISHAMAFWEGGGERGRFVWDPPDPLAPIADVAGTLPFSRWGRGDPNMSVGESDGVSVRNFVFTYGGDVPGRVPNNAGYHAGIRGRYRIQRFAGGDDRWAELYDGIRTPAGWAAFYGSDPGLWVDDEWDLALREGVFTIRVYTRTPAGTINAVPLVTFLTLDRGPPALELTRLDGSARETSVAGRIAHVVNGVIRPRIFASDARESDSGHRVSGGYFARPDGRAAEEVMFLLVHDDHRSALDSHIGHARYNFWPLPRAAAAGAAPDLPAGITVHRHGPVHDGVAYIQTTRSHADNRYAPLDDGVYWLYVFARDGAFNVGRESFPLVVEAESDRPEFDFSIGLINRGEFPVTDPNASADGTRYGFTYAGVRRNVLHPTTDIRFRVRDDDGLDLGVQGGALSSLRVTFTGSFVDADGLIRPLTERDPGFLITLGDQDVKNIFAPRAGPDSPAPREREGTIPQSLLLNLLRAPGSPYRDLLGGGVLDGLNSLPDGLYRVTVEIYDDPDFKLSMPLVGFPGREPVDRAGARVEFWIAVDNIPPAVWPSVAYIYPPDEDRRTLEYFSIRSQVDGEGNWLGTIRDDNGPIEVTGFTVRVTEATPIELNGATVEILRDLPGGPSFSGAPDSWVTLTRLEENEDTWEYRFEAWVNLSRFFPGIEAGNFHFTLRVEDRFGVPREIVRQHQQDEVSPTVMLTREIETFSRASVASIEVNGEPVGVDNAGTATLRGRLANGVISFAAHAWDNFTVDGLHWWLLPIGTGADGASFVAPGGLTGDGVVHGFYAYPAWRDSAAAPPGRGIPIVDPDDDTRVVGAFGRLSAPGGAVYIDTRSIRLPGGEYAGLPDGEYVLHLIARDAHGNYSPLADERHPRAAQRIFLLQDEDRPYFDAGIAPVAGDVRGEHTLRITGIIMDDDGFGALEPESVRIWVSREGPPPSNLSTAALDSWGTMTRDLSAADGLTLSGRDIILNVDLLEVFGDAVLYNVAGERVDGTIFYVIRAQDAWQSKLQIPLLRDYSRNSRYRAFSFTLDSLPPVIYLGSPSPGWAAYRRIFRGDFELEGYISDVHLLTIPVQAGGGSYVDRPYIFWTLNGASPPAMFPLPTTIPPVAPGQEQKAYVYDVLMSCLLQGSHEPPAWVAGFANMLEEDGEHVLELSVVDGIGLASVVTLNFTIDRTPPRINANLPGDQAASDSSRMSEGAFAWWHDATNDERRVWAAYRPLPIIVHDMTAAPILAGYVVDDFSDIHLNAAGAPDVSFMLNGERAPFRVDWEGEGRTWRWQIDLAAADGVAGILPDGVHTLSISGVRDRTSNHAEAAHFVFRTDSRNPMIALDEQPERVLGAPDMFPAGQPVLTIGGTARDTNLRNVRIALGRPGVEDRVAFVMGGASLFPGEVSDPFGVTTADWQWDEDASEWVLRWTLGLSLADYAGLTAGQSYTIEVVALDWRDRGGGSEPAEWVFTKDVLPPTIAISTAENFVFIDYGQTIHGTVADPHSDIRSVWSMMQRRDWSVTDDDDPLAWVNVFARDDLGDLDGWREIRGVGGLGGDLTGAPRNRIWRTPALGDARNAAGAQIGLDLDDGLYRIRIRAMDSSWFAGSADDFGPYSRGNPAVSEWRHFRFDREAPGLSSLTAVPDHGVLGYAGRFPTDQPVLTIDGTARDANLRTVRLRIREQESGNARHQVFFARAASDLAGLEIDGDYVLVDDAAAWTWEYEAPVPGADWDGPTWNLDWSFDLSQAVFAGLDAGLTYEIEVVAFDFRGLSSDTETWTFTKDVLPPDIVFGTEENALFIGHAQAIRGSVADLHSDVPLGLVEFMIQRRNRSAAAGAADEWLTEVDWRGMAPGGSVGGSPRDRTWSTPALGSPGDPYSLDLPDGLYRIRVRARDSSRVWNVAYDGNPAESSLYFRLDRELPDLGFAVTPPQAMSSRFGTVGVSGDGTVEDPQVTHFVPAGSIGFRVAASDENLIERVVVRVFAGTDTEYPAAHLWEHGWEGDDLAAASAGMPNDTYQLVVPTADMADGAHTVVIRAYDGAGRHREIRRGFGLDNASPGGLFSSPEAYGLGSDLSVIHPGSERGVISGETFDGGRPGFGSVDSGISRVDFRFGLLNGALPTDDALVAHYMAAAVPPLPGITTAAADTAHNNRAFDALSWFRLSMASNNRLPAGFSITVDNPFSWQINVEEDALLSLARTAGMSLPVGGLNHLPIWFRVVDGAGNVGYFHRVIRIDPDADRPSNVVNNPSPPVPGASIPQRGGSILFDGVAEVSSQAVAVQRVLYRVWIDDHDGFEGVNAGSIRRVLTHGTADLDRPITDVVDLAELNLSGGETLPGAPAEQIWFEATVDPGNVVPWAFELNTRGEITALIRNHGFVLGDPRESFGAPTGDADDPRIAHDTIRVTVDVVAFNNDPDGRLRSDIETRTFYLRSTAPVIRDVDVDIDGHTGRVTVTAYLWASPTISTGDGDPLAWVESVRIGRPEEPDPDDRSLLVNLGGTIPDLPGLTITQVTSLPANVLGLPGTGSVTIPAGQVYRLVYRMNSSATPVDGYGFIRWSDPHVPNTGTVPGQPYRLEIRVFDNSDSENALVLPITIDSFAPVQDYSRRTSPVRAGTNEIFQGRVVDGTYGMGTIDRIYAWFEDGINRDEDNPVFLSHAGQDTTPETAQQRPNVWIGRSATVTSAVISGLEHGDPGSVSIPGPLPTAGAGNDWIMRISAATQGGARRQIWDASPDGRVVEWQFTLNTNNLRDGPVVLRYIVVDTAGNAAVFQQTGIVIQNNAPMFGSVTLTSDGSTVELGRPVLHQVPPRSEGYIYIPAELPTGNGAGNVAQFVVRDDLSFNVATDSGNAPLRFRLQQVTRSAPIRLNSLSQEEFDALPADDPRRPGSLARLIGRRGVGNNINLYTIAGFAASVTVPPTTWEILGFAGPQHAGTHFVLRLTLADLARLPDDLGIYVWEYTEEVLAGTSILVGTRGEAIPNVPLAFRSGRDDDGHFAAFQGQPGRIQDGRSLFLLRAWDSVTADDPEYATEADLPENEQLHAAAVIAANVRLFDWDRPTASLHYLNPSLIPGVTGGNLDAESRDTTIRNALDPLSMAGNSTRGGLFNVGNIREQARSGHIEPRSTSPRGGFTGNDMSGNRFFDGNRIERDLVSGRIILRGHAHDNERIRRIELAITDGAPCDGSCADSDCEGDWFVILETEMDGIDLANSYPLMRVPEGMAYTVNFRENMDRFAGHNVEWAFLWDTEEFAEGSPEEGVRISVRATDWNDSEGTPAYAAGGVDDNTVNIVPYITGFMRQPQYATIRSMQGWYSFYQGEEGISALGWNLGGAPAVAAGANLMGGPGISLAGLASVDIDYVDDNGDNGEEGIDRANPLTGLHIGGRHRIAFEVPAATAGAPGLHSGRINFTIGGVPIHNHRSRTGQAWNRENLQGSRSNLWINRPYAHIWRSGPTDGAASGATGAHIPRTFMGPFDNTAGLDHPGMALEYSGVTGTASLGRLHGTWGVFGTAMVHYGTNILGGVPGLGGGVVAGDINSTRLSRGTGISVPYDPYITPDISLFHGNVTTANHMPNIAFVHMHDSNSNVRLRTNVLTQSTAVPDAGAGGRTNTDFPAVIGTLGDGGGPRRWQNVRVANAAANVSEIHPGRAHVAAYDAVHRSLRFVTQGPVVNPGGIPASTAVVIDGPSANITGAGLTNSTDAGLFSAVGFDAHGPIVAYFDFGNDTIRVAWGNGTNPGTTGWTRTEVIPTGVLRGGSGRYVSMAVDRTGGIHLAFFNNRRGSLIYAHAPYRTSGTATSTFTVTEVDNLDGVGTWTDISVDHWGNPWIVYGYQGRQGNYDGIRMAFRSRNPVAHANNVAAGSGNTGVHFIAGSGWEAVQMASPFRVRYDRLNIEAWPPSNRAATAAAPLTMAQAHLERGAVGGRAWGAAIGYSSGGADRRFRIGYFFWPVGIGATWPPAAADAAQ